MQIKTPMRYITLYPSRWPSFKSLGTSLVVQQLRLCLAMQRMQVPPPIGKLGPRRPRGIRAHATPEPVEPGNCWACAMCTPRASPAMPVYRQAPSLQALEPTCHKERSHRMQWRSHVSQLRPNTAKEVNTYYFKQSRNVKGIRGDIDETQWVMS